ncbi:MAG: hypothetical protein IT306_12005 [Chloroflexi bacterium]|nr:hypothetical protein [Chloroflexota bacterium]
MADDSERIVERASAGETPADEAALLRARIAALEAELSTTREYASRLTRERRDRRPHRTESEDRAETMRDIFERVDSEGRRVFRALVMSQMQQMRLTADLVTAFAERIERQHPGDDPDLERDLPRDLLDGWLETVDRSLEIPERTLSTFEETYREARPGRRDRARRAD